MPLPDPTRLLALAERRFPILGTGETVPWSFVEPHREWAMKHHYQTLERLAERGGLSWGELRHVVNHLSWRTDAPMKDEQARVVMLAALRALAEEASDGV